MDNNNTPALKELSQKLIAEKREYVPRETREFNRACDAFSETLTVLMTYQLNRKNTDPAMKVLAKEIFERLYQFNHYFVEQNTPKNEADTKQPELFPQS